MKRKRWGAALAALVVLWPATGLPGDSSAEEEALSRSRSAVASLQRALLHALSEALTEGGAFVAVEVCREKAPLLAEAVSKENGVPVRRTALKVRNPDNAPDEWERTVLQDFDERCRQGEDPRTMERWEVRSEEGRPVFRYLKAISMGEPCLRCHGPSLEETLARRLRELYPKDRAVGFRAGDLRGAFSVRVFLRPRGVPEETESSTNHEGGSP